MVTCPPPLYVLLNCLIRLSTTCWADECGVSFHIVMVVPDPLAALPTPPHAASPAVAVRVAATAASLYLTPDLDNMPSPLCCRSGKFATEGAIDAGQAEQLTHLLRPGVEDAAINGDGVEAVPGAPVGQGQHRPGRGGPVRCAPVPHARVPDQERPGRHQHLLPGQAGREVLNVAVAVLRREDRDQTAVGGGHLQLAVASPQFVALLLQQWEVAEQM